MADISPVSYLTKDYEGFRADLINLIPSVLPEWTDYSDSDPGIAIIELLAYGMDILSYYQDRQANESFLPTATQRQSVIDAVSAISYRLKTAVPSTTTLVFTITPQTIDYKIPKGFQVSTQSTPYSAAVAFETDTDLIIPAGKVGNEQSGGAYLYSVKATQGFTISNEVIGSSRNLPNQKFVLKNRNVIIDGPQGNSLKVYVTGGNNVELWSDVTTSVTPFTPDGKQYTWSIDANNSLTVQFGDGSNGAIPTQGTNNLLASYRIGGGLGTNVGVGTITTINTSSLVVRTVTNIVAASGGLDAETIEHAKQQAPLTLRTNNRAVTETDYNTLAKQVPGVAYAKATLRQGQANTVYLTIAPVGGGAPSDDLLNEVYKQLNDVKMITTNLTMQTPKYTSIYLTLNVVAKPTITNAEIQASVQQTLSDVLGFDNSDFGKNVYISSIYQALSSLSGVDHLSITRFTTNPRVDSFQSTGNPTWSPITINSAHTYRGLWKVEMTSPTAFKVSYNPSLDGITWVQDGTGTLGTVYNSVAAGTKISFTITAGAIPAASGDNWQFTTSSYFGDIIIGAEDFLILGSDVVVSVTGGVS
jgi:uncharacterized phage protein gp47/JayE